MDIEIGVINPMDIFKLQASNVIYKRTTQVLLGYSIGSTIIIKLQDIKIKNLKTKASKINKETE